MSSPPSLFEMWMTAWTKMVMSPWQTDVNIEKEESPVYGTEDITLKRITNYNYEMLSVADKIRIKEEYRMISIDDPFFGGFWLLIPQDGSVALRDDIDRDVLKAVLEDARQEGTEEGTYWTKDGTRGED